MLLGMKKKKLKTIDIEIAVASYLNVRTNLIVPNISWGMFLHECDLLVLTPAGYAWEIEIKTTRSDLIKDKKKRHGHRNGKIKYLYFAMPDYLEHCVEHVPERAGVILVNDKLRCRTHRRPKFNKSAYRFSQDERYQVARLGSMRIWGLKKKLCKSYSGKIKNAE